MYYQDATSNCQPSQGMTQLVKQTSGLDSSLHRERIDQATASNPSLIFRPNRQRQPQQNPINQQEHEAEFSNEFFNPAVKDPFRFDQFHHDLAAIPLSEHPAATNFRQNNSSTMASGEINENWFQEFTRNDHFDQAYQQASADSGWAEDFKRQQQDPAAWQLDGDEHNLEDIFNQAQQQQQDSVELNWEQEFLKHSDDWTEEFNTAQDEKVDVSTLTIPEVAGRLLDAVKDQDDPKFRNSSFIQFMKHLRDEKVKIEGNALVENSVVATSEDWSNDFAQKEKLGGNDWSQEFQQLNPESSADWSNEFQNSAKPAADDWVQEFQQQESNDWTSQYLQNVDHLTQLPQDEEWRQMERDWLKQDEDHFGLGYRVGLLERHEEYPFATKNPYLSDPMYMTKASFKESVKSLQSRLLELEAVVQLNPGNYEAWYLLGLGQQENENDKAAISAFTRALTPPATAKANQETIANSWLGIAVSYANENCRVEAMQALENLLRCQRSYRNCIVGRSSSDDLTLMDRVIQSLLNAVKKTTGEREEVGDARIQTALGIALNMIGEHEKAGDCFRAALLKRPEDYVLWNRLGATMANVKDYASAAQVYEHATTINPDFCRGWYNLAIAMVNQQQYETAVMHLMHVLKLQGCEATAATMESSRQSNEVWEMIRFSLEMGGAPIEILEASIKRDFHSLQAALTK